MIAKEMIVMPGNAAVKSTARVALKGFWPQAIFVCMLLCAGAFGLIYVCSLRGEMLPRVSPFLSIPAAILVFIAVLFPLFLGAFRFFYKATAGNTDGIATVFQFFEIKKYLKTLFFSAVFSFKLITVAVVTYLPYWLIKIAMSLEFKFFTENVFFYAEILLIVFGIIGTVLFVLATSKYYIAPMLYACRDDMNWTEVFYIAKHISRQSAGSFLVLLIGFTGWALLSLFGIPIVFTLPYFLASYAVHCRYAFYHYNRSLSLAENTEFLKYRSSF